MKLKNSEIETMINVIMEPNSFRNNVSIKIPAKIRYAIRVNLDRLSAFHNAFIQARADIVNGYLERGQAKEEDDKIVFNPEVVEEAKKELSDLFNIENDVDLVLVDKNAMDEFLETVALSIPEEQVLLLFTDKEVNSDG